MVRFLRNKNYPGDEEIQVDRHIGTSYDTVRAVYDALTYLIPLGQKVIDGELDDLLETADIDTLAELNAILTDATLGDASDFATAAQGAKADSALQPAAIDSLAKLNALVLDATLASQAYVDSAVAGLYDPKGGYAADTNTPDLDVSPSGVLKGDAYTVTTSGLFFTAQVDPGDLLLANQDNPTQESHWTIVNRNIDESAFASAAQGALADSAIQPGDIDTLAELNAIIADATLGDAADFATAAQGALADSALQPGDNISELTNDSGFTNDQTPAEIKAAFDSLVAAASQAEMEAGTEVNVRQMTPQRVAQAIAALAPGGASTLDGLTDVDTDKSKTPADGDVLTYDGTHWNAEVAAAGGGGGMTALYKDANYTLQADELVYSEAGLTHTLPATPNSGDKCSVWDVSDNAGSNAITVGRNGSTIMDAAEDFSLNMNGGRVDFLYTGTTWVYSYVVQTIQPSTVVSVRETKTLPLGDFGYTGSEDAVYTNSNSQLILGAYPPIISFTAGNRLKMLQTFRMPADWDGDTTTVTAKIVYYSSNTDTGDIRFQGGINGMQDGSTANLQTAANNDFAAPGTANVPYSQDITVNLSEVVAGEFADFFIARRGSDAADTHTGHMYLMGVAITYYTNRTITAAVSNNPSVSYNEQSGTSYTIQASDNGKEIIFTNAAAIAVTLPDGLPQGFQCVITQTTAAGVPTVTPATDTINGAGTGVTPSAQWKGMHLGKYSATAWVAKN